LSIKDEPKLSLNLPINDKPKINNEEVSIQLKIYLQEEWEKCLRQWTVDHGKDPDVFITITEKDGDLIYIYCNRLYSDIDKI
ncbi:11672_t:CDS:1, partial [Diversispora eburnea]